ARPARNHDVQSAVLADPLAHFLAVRERHTDNRVSACQRGIFCARPQTDVVVPGVVDADAEIAHHHALDRICGDRCNRCVRKLRTAVADDTLRFRLEEQEATQLPWGKRRWTYRIVDPDGKRGFWRNVKEDVQRARL